MNYSKLLTSNQSLQQLLKCHLSCLKICSAESDGHCLLTIHLITQYNTITESVWVLPTKSKSQWSLLKDVEMILESKAQSHCHSNQVWQC